MSLLAERVQNNYGKSLEEMTDLELYQALLEYIKEKANDYPLNNSKKKLYYVSAEFLIGKLLSNNLLNLGLYDEVESELQSIGRSVAEVEAAENEPSLGNGGLGRLAACFLDSIATLGINGDGVGINYHFGLFKQLLVYREQHTVPDAWLGENSWLKKSEKRFEIPFNNFTINSVLYDLDIFGYNNTKRNRLRLFDIESLNSDLIEYGTINFDKTNIMENLTLFLYPDDSDHNGQLLRIFQQYFMVSNAAQLIIDEAIERGSNIHDLADFAVIQINDTHPALIIPELIRLLTQQHHIGMDEAVEIVKNTIAFTNHTILSEALEKWPMGDLERVNPDIAHIIRDLDGRVKQAHPNQPGAFVIDNNGRAHMANMSIHYGFSVNGVAQLHTDILKDSELSEFEALYPGRINNKTNGITFRRWIMNANKALSSLFDEKLGEEWRVNHDLTELEKYADDKDFQEALATIKAHDKRKLKDHLLHRQATVINENSIIDVQIKRIHEYKRQQMLALYIVHKYFDIKKGNKPKTPITILFGGKAAPAYIIAQDIIHFIMVMSEIIARDPEVSPYLQVVMVENYNVTAAEYLIPAADVSEQISLASKEASGTGNMKFMLNGALTIATLDGANVEIADLVGEDNIYLFGKKADEIVQLYETNGYNAYEYYDDPALRSLVDFIISDEAKALGNHERLYRLHNDIVHKDYFMALIDLKEFIETKERMYADYEDQDLWMNKVVKNIAKAGYFSSDRTITDYNRDIWHLEADYEVNIEKK
ncbi:glycogen/starch/alpha-glucan phosphorylase [Aerococcaceae bacterium DSM 111020]|nr:glycogen/starch/alpha-glucan phosphorylase [Aerococcaceae bacterium DSM 111020]